MYLNIKLDRPYMKNEVLSEVLVLTEKKIVVFLYPWWKCLPFSL